MTSPATPGDPGSDWYCAAQDGLEQGDILLSLRIVVPIATAQSADYTFGSRIAKVIVLTQTCDLQKSAQKDLLVAEVHSYSGLVAAGMDHLKKTEYRQGLARGSAISEFLLPPNPEGALPWSLVAFRDVFVIPKQVVLAAATVDGNVLRLASPYKEYLSQAFGRFVMRVGLPATLHEFEKYKPW